MSKAESVAVRLERWSMPEPFSGCVLWTGCVGEWGYGVIGIAGKNRGAHRVAYELARGPIPSGLTIDHLCKVPSCINPDHMEPVTVTENNRRRWGNSAKDTRYFCAKGHLMEGHNLKFLKNNGQKACRICVNRRAREWNLRQRMRLRAAEVK